LGHLGHLGHVFRKLLSCRGFCRNVLKILTQVPQILVYPPCLQGFFVGHFVGRRVIWGT